MSDRQRTTVVTAITIVAVFVIVVFVAAIFWGLGAFVARFSNVFLPLAVAGVLAMVMKPAYNWLREKLKLPPPIALVALLLAIMVPFLGFLGFFGTVAVQQAEQLIENLPAYWEQSSTWFEERWPRAAEALERAGTMKEIREAIEGREDALVRGARQATSRAFSISKQILGVVGSMLSWAVLPVYLAFFLMVEPIKIGHLDDALPFLKGETRQDVVYLVKEFVNILVAFFRGQLIVAFLQGCLFAIGFSAVGLRYGLILGLMLGFLNIIPYLGSIVGLGIALPLAFFQGGGGLWLVAAVIAVFTVVQLIEGYVLTPKVMGDRTGLHPMAIIVAVFFWGSALGGITGMILAIPLTAFLVVFWRLVRDKYIDELI
jgi:predicted PurR-regulated permease PerM